MDSNTFSSMKGSPVGILAIVVIVLWIIGLLPMIAGVFVGTLLVLGMMATIERIPGFWKFALNPVGYFMVLAGTAWMSHVLFGTGTLTGMIALAWALLFKVLLIESVRSKLGTGSGSSGIKRTVKAKTVSERTFY